MPKPDVDAIRNIPPAIAIVQRNPVKTSRSTVGTTTEVYDFMRLLWAKVGTIVCPDCGRKVEAVAPSQAAAAAVAAHPGARAYVVFPLIGAKAADLAELPARGFVRVLANGRPVRLGVEEAGEPAFALSESALASYSESALAAPGTSGGTSAHAEPPADLAVIVDRLALSEESRGRLAEAIETAYREGDGVAEVRIVDGERLRVVHDLRCGGCHRRFEEPVPRLFSFNNPFGACPACKGFGNILAYDEKLIVPNPALSLARGAIDPFTKPSLRHWHKRLLAAARSAGVDVTRPWPQLPARERAWVIEGDRTKTGKVRRGGYPGALGLFEKLETKRYKLHVRVFLSRYKSQRRCEGCGGGRLRPEAGFVRVGGLDIAAVSRLTVRDARAFFEGLALDAEEAAIARDVRKQIGARLEFMEEVGLSYLTLDRLTKTLSGGEAQRIHLAGQLGARLAGTLYVLDEPSVGLHARDARRLIEILHRLRDNGNTVLVVEHDREIIRAADHVVELGPRAGEQGGEVVWEGSREAFATAGTLTARYLRGEERVSPPRARRGGNGKMLVLTGAAEHNLKGAPFRVPLRRFVCVTGVSGSGKSTLVHRTLVGALLRIFNRRVSDIGRFETLQGMEHLKGLVVLDQEPIGRTPRSNPITYLKAFDEIRRLFAQEPSARARGFGPGHFSFNVPGGRCEACAGEGAVVVEMHFLADLYVECQACRGRRFNDATLEVRHRGLDIHETLWLTASEAMSRFADQPKLRRTLALLDEVGLGYLRLGQPATTLSGGEAQRLKIAAELARARARDILYVLDEPTTGLHMDDVNRLLRVLHRLVDAGNTVLVIEHNLDVIRSADHVIDLGPEGGEEGGWIVAEGPPEVVARSEPSFTGRCLREAFGENLR
jgi:excinuclease ABC subunit A